MNPQLMTTSPDWTLLGRYLAGETTADESAAVRAWLDRHPGEAGALTALDDAARRALAEEHVDVEAALRRVKARPDTPARSERARPPSRLAAVLAVAAVLLFAALLWRGPVASETAARSFSTDVAVSDTISLPDGTIIVMGPDTRVDVRGQEIDLAGAAYLKIAPQSPSNFVVRAAGAVIRDMGTEFSVRAYRDEPLTIVVRQGIVEVALAATRLTLDSGKVAMVDSGGRLVVRPDGASPDDLAWTQGRLVFRDASMPEVTADLRRWYGVELRVTDTTLLDRHFTGSFSTESPQRVLEVIALALGAQLQRRGDTALFAEREP
jgi:transmembrane sensor